MSSAAVVANIRERRTNLRIDPHREVDRSILTELIELAAWAPNHHLTQPWRFAVVSGDARARLGETVAKFQQSQGESDFARLDKTRSKFLRAPHIILVGCQSANDRDRTEDRDATAAAVQNLLLAATSHGLNSSWGSGAVCHAPGVVELCDFPVRAQIIAAIYIGFSLGDVPVPNRNVPIVNWMNA